ncbi:HtaA domain-containing protein [Streptomyces sp. NPDC087294]|uniref:HtaA domain-containing protein n=1 Tax=Streptomyces sp. NPDC087294 TaxID=3365777 RepID=UPI003814B493
MRANPATPDTPATSATPAVLVGRRRRSVALAAAVATAAVLGATVLATAGATTASAAEVPLSGYELTWGIKQSYRTYVTGFAMGTFTPSAGATQAADNGAFTFVEGAGTYDATGHTVDLAFQGGLTIQSKLHGFEITLSDVKFDSKDAEITADVTKDGTTTDDVPLATVTVTQSMKEMATTLTKQAADVFGSAGYENAAGDPLTVVQPTASTSPAPTSTPSPTGNTSPSPTPTAPETSPTPNSPSPSASSSASPSATATEPATEGEVVNGRLGWGVKESFRSYVVGGVANGKITASGGATQATGNGAFTFVNATGSYDRGDKGPDSLSAAFEGAVNFKGHETNGSYALDLTLSDLHVKLADGSGQLSADVTSLGTTTQDVVLAELKSDSGELTAKDDVITVDDVTATLTEAGATAFSGYYQAGTALDPVDLSVALSADAELPSGDGSTGGTGSGSSGGSGEVSGTTGGGSVSGGTGSTTGGVTGGLAATGSDIPVAALGTAAAVTIAAGAGVVLAVRRRRPVE